jgi:hypothetical protein
MEEKVFSMQRTNKISNVVNISYTCQEKKTLFFLRIKTLCINLSDVNISCMYHFRKKRFKRWLLIWTLSLSSEIPWRQRNLYPYPFLHNYTCMIGQTQMHQRVRKSLLICRNNSTNDWSTSAFCVMQLSADKYLNKLYIWISTNITNDPKYNP